VDRVASILDGKVVDEMAPSHDRPGEGELALEAVLCELREETRRPPRRERSGALPALLATWALVPAGLFAYSRLVFLPGEAWGFNFISITLLLPLWALFGLPLLVVLLVVPWTRRTSREWLRRLGLGVGAVALAVGAWWLVGAVPWQWTVPRIAARAFARATLEGDVVSVPGDQYFSGRGDFVREVATAARSDRALLRIHGFELELPREPTERIREAGSDWLIAVPLRDGWWYVYRDL
jgi:hypothetical protein